MKTFNCTECKYLSIKSKKEFEILANRYLNVKRKSYLKRYVCEVPVPPVDHNDIKSSIILVSDNDLEICEYFIKKMPETIKYLERKIEK